jgi:23S rRNA (uracil1939-C5)-methyltransferase
MEGRSQPGADPGPISVRVRIKKIVYPGRSMGELDGKVVFTDDGLPGELVEVRPTREKPSFIEARTIAVLEASPGRVMPRCGHYKACSPWQTIEPGLQLEIKGGEVREIFGRELRIDLPEVPVVPSPAIWAYRNRARFHILRDGDEVCAAYHEPGEEAEYIRTDHCALVPDEINSLLGAVVEEIGSGDIRGVTDVEIRRSDADGRMLIAAFIDEGADMAAVREAFHGVGGRFPRASGVGLVRNGRRIVEVPLFGQSRIEESVAGARFRIGPRSFFQVNSGLLAAVAEEMRGLVRGAGDPTIADFYCGVGTFGILLAPSAKEVFGIEPDEENIRFLKKNLGLNRVGNYAVCEGTGEEWIDEILERRTDVVILDPPRRGVEPSIVAGLAAKPVPLVIYLSCNPSTLARDLKGLLKAYRLDMVKIFDFFPHTPHIETLVTLRR